MSSLPTGLPAVSSDADELLQDESRIVPFGLPPPPTETLQVTAEPPSRFPLCAKCGYQVDVFRSIMRNKSLANPKFICRSCNCIATMLNKKLDMSNVPLKDMPEETQQQFWRTCAATCLKGDRFSYSKIKALITETCVQQRLSSSTATVSTESLPLSVWKSRGFDVVAIEEKAEKEHHPIFGDVYKVPLKTVTRAEVESNVRQMMLKAERTLKRKSIASSSSSQAPPAQDAGIICVDDFDLSEPEAAPIQVKGKRQKGLVDKADAKAEKDALLAAKAAGKKEELEKKTEKSEIKKHNQKVFMMSTKTVSATTPLLLELQPLVNKPNDRMPTFLLGQLSTITTEVLFFKTTCSDRLSKCGKAAAKQQKLDDLPFTQTEVTEKVKEASGVLAKYKKMLSLV